MNEALMIALMGNRRRVTLSFSVAPVLTRTVTWNGAQWREYQIASSCTLTVTGQSPTNCAIWACGGGANGNSYTNGGGGGYTAQVSGALPASAAITVGAGNGDVTTFGNLLTASGGSAKNGGSGGGASQTSGGGTGQGTTTIPFADAANWTSIPCGGGGGGGIYSAQYKGGNGGSNGSIGTDRGSAGTGQMPGGTGGATGGGNGGYGGSSSVQAGFAGTYYGAGGGGGGQNGDGARGSVGTGYQGLCVIRVPANSVA